MFVGSGTLTYPFNTYASLFLYNIDMSQGDSGAPVLNSGNQIVGVNYAEADLEKDPTSPGNFGNKVSAHQSFLADFIPCPSSTSSVYRVYDSNNGDHMLTRNATERNSAASAGWTYEGIKMCQPTSSSISVYRLNNPNTGEHFFTTNANEKTSLTNAGWKYEQVAFYGASASTAGAMPVYRLNNPNAKNTASHFFTTSTSERDSLVKSGWKLESSSAWYAIKK
jgi:hypothetical protein